MVNIKLIIGSTRPNRFGPQIAGWLKEQSAQIKNAEFEIVDVQDLGLPFLDEPQPPLMGNYQNAHTKSWANIVGDSDGFVFITPEYNHATTPALLNAIDFLGAEWAAKPVTFASYGADAGGARAVEQLRPLVANLHMYDLAESVTVANYWGQLGEDGKFSPTEDQDERAQKMLTKLVFWATEMKASRAKLNA